MKLYISLLLILVSVVSFISCKTDAGKPESLQATMMTNYAATSKLFSYVWDPVEFSASRNDAKIKKYLSILETNLHGAHIAQDLPKNDPAMSVTLDWFRELIRDAKSRFESGNKDYANWKLRSMTNACIACHSRSETKTGFLADDAIPAGDSVEYQFAAAQFLFATRQFDKASDKFYQLAKSLLELESGRSYALEVLKEWLVVEIRVLDRPIATKKSLELLQEKISSQDPRIAILFEKWIADLTALGKMAPITDQTAVTTAKRLLQEAMLDREFAKEEHLVKSLKSSAILHNYLDESKEVSDKKSATFLLAVAYQHIPIESLSIYRKLYLEKCIRLFPGSDEAKQAFGMYKEAVEADNTGSGGLHLETDQQAKLETLRTLAFGQLK